MKTTQLIIMVACLMVDPAIAGETGDEGVKRLTYKTEEAMIVVEESENGIFLLIEPGCGKYSLKEVGVGNKSLLYQLVSMSGAPVDQHGKISPDGLLKSYALVKYSESGSIDSIEFFSAKKEK